MLTLATAGHIDHGKSSLIKALTSIDPDRLPEEKERGMTIDLGFAWLQLPSGELIGIIDVPGHKQFVHNVIPGLFGIDAVLMVVAADDGWMPQTEEHLRILDLLGINNGIVVLNKVDLTPDRDWLDLVRTDISAHLSGTSLEGAPIISVSSRTGEGISELKDSIARLASSLKPRQDIGKPRLPIDRVFNIKGSGVVVTGTMSGGTFQASQDVVISPSNLAARIRGVESFKHILPRAMPGSRVALNLTGVKREELKRGDQVLGGPLPLSRVLNVELKLLQNAETPIRNMAEVVLFMETRELLCRVVLIGTRFLKPGESSFAQLRLNEEVAALIGGHFIIRRQSPAMTIGGGVILEPNASRYKLSEVPELKEFLENRKKLELDHLIISEVFRHCLVPAAGLLQSSNFSTEEVSSAVEKLFKSKKLFKVGTNLVDAGFWRESGVKLIDMVHKEIETDKLRKGLDQAVARSVLGISREVFDALVQELVSTGKLVRLEESLALPEHRQQLSVQQEAQATSILKMFQQNYSSPPTLREIETNIPRSTGLVKYLAQRGELVELPEGVLMLSSQFKVVQQEVELLLKENGRVSIQDLAARFGFSRKYTIPLLTQMDRIGITRREGDARVPGKKMAL
jgi:selenocysteine-specific elongation factor